MAGPELFVITKFDYTSIYVFYRSESIETSISKRWPPLIGHMFITSPVLQVQPEKKDAKFTDYLICPPYFYDKTNYPTFTSGTGYIMPWWSVPCFYQVNKEILDYFCYVLKLRNV